MANKSSRSQVVESINFITAEQLPAQFDELSDEDLQYCVGGRALAETTICETTTITVKDGTTTTTTSTTTCTTYSSEGGKINGSVKE